MKILDTQVLFKIVANNRQVQEAIRGIDPKELATTSINVYEFYMGAYINEERRESRIKDIQKIQSTIRILNFDKKSARYAGQIRAKLMKEKIVSSEAHWFSDVLIAGIAKREGATVITFDCHFENMDIDVQKLREEQPTATHS